MSGKALNDLINEVEAEKTRAAAQAEVVGKFEAFGKGVLQQIREATTAFGHAAKPLASLSAALGLPMITPVEGECTECVEGKITRRLCKCGREEDEHDDVDAQDPDACKRFVWDKIDLDPEDCWACRPRKLTTTGLTYVAVGNGMSCVLDSECGALLSDLSEIGGSLDDCGVEFNEDEGIWKAVVALWANGGGYFGDDHDHGYNVVGEWEGVESYPEPDCSLLGQGTPCEGMRRARGDDGPWACDEHASQVA